MRRVARGTLCAGSLALLSAPAATARPDGPLAPYLRHVEQHLVLEWPAQGTLTDGFGPRWGRLHAGLDIGILRSPDVRAAAGGVVREVGRLEGFAGYGLSVVVDVPTGHRMLYAHLSRATVTAGQLVRTGERLGLAGCTGSCTGTHLHFELHGARGPEDPLAYLSR